MSTGVLQGDGGPLWQSHKDRDAAEEPEASDNKRSAAEALYRPHPSAKILSFHVRFTREPISALGGVGGGREGGAS